MQRQISRYGWIPDLPDQRDHLYAAPPRVLAVLPAKVDLRPRCPPVLDQGELGSCTANAIANAFRFDEMKQKVAKPMAPSRLFIYYNERAMEAHRQRRRRHDPRRHQDHRQAGRLPGNRMALRHRQVRQEAAGQVLQGRAQVTRPCPTGASPRRCRRSRAASPTATRSSSASRVYESFESQAVAKTGKMPMPASPAKNASAAMPCWPSATTTPAKRVMVMQFLVRRLGRQGLLLPCPTTTSAATASPTTSGRCGW